MKLKKISKTVVTGAMLSLLVVTSSVNVKAYVAKVSLTSSDMWVNSDKVSARQIAVYGNVNKKSKKNVSFVTEYRGSDSEWHYDKWYGPYSPDTNVPTLNSTYRPKCDMRLQLNPEGVADAGKGGIATCYVNLVK